MRALVFVLTVVMMSAGSGCEDCDCPDAPQPTAATTAGAGGWRFTLGDMAKFGLDGVVYEGSEAYPSEGGRALLDLVLTTVDDR